MRYRLALLIGTTVAAVLVPLSALRPQSDVTSLSIEKPFARLRALSQPARVGFSRRDAIAVGRELGRKSFPVSVMLSPGQHEAAVAAFAEMLADRQLAWQTRRGSGAGIHEEKLLHALNRQLELNDASAYLKIRPQDLRRVRVQMWMRAPELSSGIHHSNARKGTTLFGATMSPLEAFMLSDLLLYQKALNPNYVRTSIEERRQLRQPKAEPEPYGLYALEPNPRGDEFLAHLELLARGKWQTAESVLQTVADILDESER